MNRKKTYRKVFVTVQTPNGPTRECLWAIKITGNTARINNIPHLSDEVALHDLVLVGASGEVLEVLERSTRTRHLTYDSAADSQEAERQWRQIVQHFGERRIDCESAAPGMLSMAVPMDVSDAEVQQVVDRCPIPLK